jgi:hypothetical protein
LAGWGLLLPSPKQFAGFLDNKQHQGHIHTCTHAYIHTYIHTTSKKEGLYMRENKIIPTFFPHRPNTRSKLKTFTHPMKYCCKPETKGNTAEEEVEEESSKDWWVLE